MASLTAIELGADSCVLVRTSVRGGAVHVSAVETLDPAAFPGVDAFTTALKQARRTLKLPRRSRVVLWGLPDGANRKDIAVQALLAPLTGAGFRVDRVVSPCNALAALARVKSVRGDGATCWLAINRGGVAIVVVRPGNQLYSYSFAWDSSVGSSGSQARLLQRYSLVAILGPEVKRAMAEARKHGITVDAVVTCGDLPDLRSLTMPLIEELDVEVETLDSLEGLVVKPEAAERLAEVAPALRLACAGLIARGTRAWDEKRRQSVRRTGAALRFAAAAALVLALGYAWYMRATLPAVSTLMTRATDNTPAAPVKPPWKPPARAATDAAKSRPPAVGASAPRVPAPAASDAAKRAESNPPAVSDPAKKPESNPPAVSAPAKKPESNPPAVSAPAKKPESNPPAVSAPAKKPESNPPAVSDAAKRPASNPPVVNAATGSAKPDPATPAQRTASTAANAPTSVSPVVRTTSTTPAPRVPAPSAPAPRVPAPTVSDAAKRAESNPPAVSDAAKRAESNPPAVSDPAKKPESNPPAVSDPAKKPESNPPAVAAAAARALEIAPRPSAPAPRAADPAPRQADPGPRAPNVTPPGGSGLNTPAVPADKPDAARNRPLPAPLKDPLPRVTTILVSSDRRFATIDNGLIIGIGDVLGRRLVVAIDERTVVLREPSGVQIRVGLGGRLVAVGRSDR